MRFISWFGRFHEDFPLKEGTVRVSLPFSRDRLENQPHNLGKALSEGLGLLCASFISLCLSPLYPFHLSIPFTSLSLYLYLSYISLPHSISPSTFLSLSLLLSVILFGVSNGRFRPCLINSQNLNSNLHTLSLTRK